MPERPLIARWFLWGGGLLAIVGLILWITLPIRGTFPPYLVTALLAMAYGEFCRRRELADSVGKS